MNAKPDALKLASVPIVDRGIGWQADATATLKSQATEIAALKETLHNELDGNLRLRDLGGAKATECMTTFLERVFAERELYAELLRHALDALEYHREQTRPIARNDSVIERLREQLGA
jgi:hypothetical protein